MNNPNEVILYNILFFAVDNLIQHILLNVFTMVTMKTSI